MHRLLDRDICRAGAPSPAVLKHLKVLRPKEGEEFEIFDGKGNSKICTYHNSSLVIRSSSLQTAPRPKDLTLFACITKGSRWDWTIEKAVELGVTRIVPVISERTIVRIPPAERAAKRERWLRIAEAAAEQSDAKYLPEILPATDFAAAVQLAAQCHCLVGALTEKTLQIAAAVGREESGTPPNAIFVGPEGDFTPAELASLCEVATPVSFGSTILRAETAAIYGLSVLKSNLDVQAS